MIDDTPSRTSRAFDMLASRLDAAAEPSTLVEAALRAGLYAYEEAKDAPDPRTDLDLGAALDCSVRIERQGGDAGPYDIEGLAAYSLERSLTALRRSWEIKAGLCQPMTAGRMNRKSFGVDDPTRLGKPDQSGLKAWLASLRARLPWARPEKTRTPPGLREITDKYRSTLDWLKVPEEVQRRVDARLERDRQMMDPLPRPMEETPPRAMESPAPAPGVTIH